MTPINCNIQNNFSCGVQLKQRIKKNTKRNLFSHVLILQLLENEAISSKENDVILRYAWFKTKYVNNLCEYLKYFIAKKRNIVQSI